MNDIARPSPALVDAALQSEAMLFGRSIGAPPIGGGRILFAKPLAKMPECTLTLKQIQGDAAWAQYTDLRESVEKELGNHRSDTERMVLAMRDRAKRLALKWHFALEAETPVGAVGLMTFAGDGWYGRLQEVHVFTEHRKKGLGNQLLAALEVHGLDLGLTALCADADEDSWQPAWLERHGYLRCARIGIQAF